MRLSIFHRKPAVPGRPMSDEDRSKSTGAREYDARFHERAAARLAAQGDKEGALEARASSTEARRPGRSTRDRRDKDVDVPGALPGSPHGDYRIYRVRH